MNILVGYDPPYEDNVLLDRAIRDARAFGARVYLVTSFLDGKEAEPERVNQAEKSLQKAQEYLRQSGVESECHVLVRNMTPGEDLVAFAEEIKAEEILLKAKKLSKVGKLLTGSNAQHVILHADCDVIVVK